MNKAILIKDTKSGKMYLAWLDDVYCIDPAYWDNEDEDCEGPDPSEYISYEFGMETTAKMWEFRDGNNHQQIFFDCSSDFETVKELYDIEKSETQSANYTTFIKALDEYGDEVYLIGDCTNYTGSWFRMDEYKEVTKEEFENY